MIAHALDPELDGDVRHGIVVAGVVVRELHVRRLVRDERNEAEAVRDEFVAEARGVLDHLDEVDGDGGHLRDDHATERVGDGRVGTGEDELDGVLGHILHHDVGPPLSGILLGAHLALTSRPQIKPRSPGSVSPLRTIETRVASSIGTFGLRRDLRRPTRSLLLGKFAPLNCDATRSSLKTLAEIWCSGPPFSPDFEDLLFRPMPHRRRRATVDGHHGDGNGETPRCDESSQVRSDTPRNLRTFPPSRRVPRRSHPPRATNTHKSSPTRTGRRTRTTRTRYGPTSSASSRPRMPGPTPPSRHPSKPRGESAARASAPPSIAGAGAQPGTRRSSIPPRRSSRSPGSTPRRIGRTGTRKARGGSAPSAAAAGTSPRSVKTSTRC